MPHRAAQRYLLELTGLPTAAGREHRVIDWVERWTRRRQHVRLTRDRFGNLMLAHANARSRRPIILAAHMDHPAFVVAQVQSPRLIEAEFRGGVADRFFKPRTPVTLHRENADAVPGRIVRVKRGVAAGTEQVRHQKDKRVVIELDQPTQAQAGDVVTWGLPQPRIRSGRLHAPACDDLAGVAAAIAAFEQLLRPVRSSRARTATPPDVRVLLTRAEEVGFIGAIAACRSGFIPTGTRLIALENSKSFTESPIGSGPIVRVGDRTSTFDPDLTYRVGRIAQALAEKDPSFKWQRRLMPGGTCEATAYQALGYTATCLCLPLGNYHNMNEPTGRIDSETISLADYHGLVRLLVEVGRSLDDPSAAPQLRRRMDELFQTRRSLLQ